MTWLLILALLIVAPAGMYVGALMERRRHAQLIRQLAYYTAACRDELDDDALSILDPKEGPR